MFKIALILGNDIFLIVSCFLTAGFISFYSIPRILKITRLKNVYDVPNDRTSHHQNTPTLGGVALFAALLISTSIFTKAEFIQETRYYIAALTILFFIGVKDDILSIKPWKKLVAQIVAALLLIILGNVRFMDLYGFMGINELSNVGSIVLSLFVFLIIINCVNLIDGIDGLASGMAILTSLILSFWGYLIGNGSYIIISVSLLGALIPFFIYNVFGKKNKLFMGDTGALITGLTIAVLLIQFNNLNINTGLPYRFEAAPAISIALFFIPLYDVLQVFTIRLFKKKSPFSPDKNHLHHLILNLNGSHLKTSILLISINLCVFVVAVFIQSVGIICLTFMLLFFGICLSLVLNFLSKRKH